MTSQLSYSRNVSFALLVFGSMLSPTLTAFSQPKENTDSIPPIGAGPLDGRIYIGTSGVIGDTKSNTEEKIIFQRGWFKSFAFESVGGFRETDYTAEKKGNAYTFHAEAKHEKNGRMVWDGTVTDDSLKASAIWYRPEMDSVIVWTTAWIQKPFDPLHKPLDGKIMVGKIKAKRDSANKEDSVVTEEQLSFADGKFRSMDSEAHGFAAHEYYVNPRYDTLYFSAIVPGPKHSERRWRGWVFKKKMEATIEWDQGTGNSPVILKFTGNETKQDKK